MADVVELSRKLLSLEFQLKVLQAQLRQSQRDRGAQPGAPFAALEGVWRGEGNFSLEEIREVEPKLPPIE